MARWLWSNQDKENREIENVRKKNIHKIQISLENSHWQNPNIDTGSQWPVVSEKSSLYWFCLSFYSLSPVPSLQSVSSCKSINLLDCQSTPGPGQGAGKIKSFIKTETPRWTTVDLSEPTQKNSLFGAAYKNHNKEGSRTIPGINILGLIWLTFFNMTIYFKIW